MYLLEADNPVPQLLSTTRESHSSARGIIIAMLQFFRLIALVSLIASCEVTSEDITVTPFGCHRNVDALCSIPVDGGQQTRECIIFFLPLCLQTGIIEGS
ncbi:hypothetical protein H4Q26_006342 [Puccinia striiformis f. sp. tritici PST-130]|nr:hypothetical protein H4Q26_006342 [Puccinia striiformis f. sp. tritici PST-130]